MLKAPTRRRLHGPNSRSSRLESKGLFDLTYSLHATIRFLCRDRLMVVSVVLGHLTAVLVMYIIVVVVFYVRALLTGIQGASK